MYIPVVEYDGNRQALPVETYPEFFDKRNRTFGGFDFNFLTRGTFDDTPEKRKETYEELWSKGDFHFWLATYHDMMFDEKANKEAYDFWKSKVRARIHDPKLQEIFAPEKQPHALGCKRISLENGFYEIFNQPNVKVVDTSATPITEVDAEGIRTTEGHFDFDSLSTRLASMPSPEVLRTSTSWESAVRG